jgi:hypothetical protein
MKTTTFEVSEQGLAMFSIMLLWWETIRKYYKDTNHLSICLDLSYDNLMSAFENKNKEM